MYYTLPLADCKSKSTKNCEIFLGRYNGGMRLIEDLEIPARAARKLGIPQRTLADAILRGKIPTETLAGGTVVVRLSDVQKWDATRQDGPGRPRNEKA